MFFLKLLVFFLSHSWFVYTVKPSNVRIGVIPDPADDIKQKDPKFWSYSNDYQSTVTIVPVVANVLWWDSLQVTRAVCSLFSQGVDGLLSFLPPNMSPILSSYANTYGLPLITKSSPHKYKVTAFDSEVKMIPNTDRAVFDLLGFYKWKSFAFMYDSDDGPFLLQRLLDTNIQAEAEAVWRVSNGEQAARFLQFLVINAQYQQKKDIQNVIFATDNDLLEEALVSMPMTFVGKLKFHFISAHPVLSLQKRYFPVWHLVTRLCLVDPNATAYKNLESRWLTMPQPYGRISEPSKNVVPENAVLTRDAIALLSKSYDSFVPSDDIFGRTDDDSGSAVQTECSQNPDKNHIHRSIKGSKASDHLKQTFLDNGVTGKVKFDESGERTDFNLHIFETASSVTKKVGEWYDYEGLKMSSDKTSSKELNDDPPDKNGKEGQLDKKTLIVTSVLTVPYLMLKQSPASVGNDRFEGFVKDLLDQVTDNLHMQYELRLVKDGRYGTYNGTSWNGMIGEVIRGEADVAVAPLTVTAPREAVLDFTKPFMSLGLNILMKKPAVLDGNTSARLSAFGFLSAFSYDTWLVLIAAYVFFGAGFFAVSRFTGAPDRIRSVDTKGSDQLSLCSSFWFATGSLFLQNTGMYPRSVSHRVMSVVWWILTLVTISAYIGSLSSMLIKERTKIQGAVDTYLTSFQMLKNFIETGSPAIGLVASGSTEAFFKSSEVGIYHDYGKYLEQNRGVITKSYQEGAERVRNSNGAYAFIMESASSEFISNHAPCDTVATAGYLDSRAYAMAVKKGSAFRDTFDKVLLDMLEFGALRQIYEKWWHSDTECSNPSLDVLPGLYYNSLTADEVSGVFYILAIGAVAASIAALIEYFIQYKKISVAK